MLALLYTICIKYVFLVSIFCIIQKRHSTENDLINLELKK